MMMVNEIKNILVPLDFNKRNHKFLNVVAAIAKRHSAKIHFLNVLKSTYVGTGNAMSGKFYYHGNAMMENSRNFLEIEEKNFKEGHDISCTSSTAVGTVSGSVCEYASKNKIDLIIMGVNYPKRRPGFISSNTYEIVANSSIPVMTVPLNFSKISFSKLLYPVRDIDGAISKLDSVLPIARKNASEINFVGLATKKQKNSEITVNNALKFLKVKMTKHKLDNNIQEVASTDVPEVNILKACDNCEADLVAVNVHNGKSKARLFKNNFTENMIYKSKIPVLFYKKENAPLLS